MKNLMNLMLTFWKDESGQDMAEYALLLVLIAVVVASTVLFIFGDAISDAFQSATDALEEGATP